MKPYYRGTIPEDVPKLAAEMRPEDAREVTSTGTTVMNSVWDGFTQSTPCFTAFGKHGEILAIWGVVPSENGGSIWLLGSVHLEKYKKFFFKTSKQLLPVLLKVYPKLSNYMDDRNELHRVYLKALGAQFSEGVRFGDLHYSHFQFRR